MFSNTISAQNQEEPYSFIDAQYFSGIFLRHNKNVAHLVTDHPSGFMLSYNRRTSGNQYWHQAYNYPDWGISFQYQDFNNPVLGQNYTFYGHLNFYFLKRNLQLKLAQGVGLNTNPFDVDTNFKNTSYGSAILTSTVVQLQYRKRRLWNRFGVSAGITFSHHSNGSFKAPNAGSNIAALHAGISYDVDSEFEVASDSIIPDRPFKERIRYNLVARGGVNQSDFIGLSQKPFLVISAFADKRITYKSSIQLGVDVFFSKFLEEEIEYRAISFPGSGLTGDEDYKRVGVFLGHELRFGRLAVPFQFGYYVYWPYEYEKRFYQRVGTKYYITEKFFAVMAVKAHNFNAEVTGFGVGVRL